LLKATLDPRYKLPGFIYAMRDAGCDGVKSGRGFYDWSDPKNPRALPFSELTRRR
jgi:3-hydroxyacyl-CoA dehydrogenase